MYGKNYLSSVDIGNSQLTGRDALAQMDVLNFNFGTRKT